MAWQPDKRDLMLGHKRAMRVKQLIQSGDRSRIRIELAGYYNHQPTSPEDEAAWKELAKVGATLGLSRFGNEKKVKDAMFQPKQLSCSACGGTGRNRTTGMRCDVCRGKRSLSASTHGLEPVEIAEPGKPSGWGERYRTEDLRARAHRALDKVLDRKKKK